MDLSHLSIMIEQETNTLVTFRCLVPVLTRSRRDVRHVCVILVRRHSIGGQEALFAHQCLLLFMSILVGHNSDGTRG